MTKQQKIFNFIVDLAQKGFGLGWNESVYLADHILTHQDKMGVVIKVDKKINGNLVNNLWDAMQPVDLDECRLLVKQALEGAGYSAWESLKKEEENETT